MNTKTQKKYKIKQNLYWQAAQTAGTEEYADCISAKR